MRVRIWKTLLLCQEMYILKVSCFPWGVFWSPACAKKVITENSEATPQSYEGANYDLLFQLIISHGLIQPTLSLICIIFSVSKARHGETYHAPCTRMTSYCSTGQFCRPWLTYQGTFHARLKLLLLPLHMDPPLRKPS